MAGVVFGSVGGSLPSPTSYLAGASAGVYALIAAHVSTLIMNWKEDGAVFDGRNKKHKSVSRSLDPLIRFIYIKMIQLLQQMTCFQNCTSDICHHIHSV